VINRKCLHEYAQTNQTKEMNMIGYQAIIRRLEECRLAAIATLRDIMRYAGDNNTGDASHSGDITGCGDIVNCHRNSKIFPKKRVFYTALFIYLYFVLLMLVAQKHKAFLHMGNCQSPNHRR
jgi:hypothetical protein